MIRRVPLLLCLVIASAASATPARAQSASSAGDEDVISPDRPGIANGSGTIGAARVQLETGLQVERHNDDGLSRDVYVPTLVRIGLTGTWELRVEGNTASWTTAEPAGAPHSTTAGFAPISVGTKYTFYDSHADDHHLSMGALVRVFPPSGSGAFHANRTSTDVLLLADWDISERWSLTPNIGFGRYAAGDGSGTFGTALGALTLGYQASETLNPFIDVGLQSASDKAAPGSIVVDGGVAWIVGRNVQLDVSVGQGVHGPAPRPFIGAGISIRGGRGTHHGAAH